MAGQLPGIETARRRRCYNTKAAIKYGTEVPPPSPSSSSSGHTRRPFYCLYSSTLEFISPPWATSRQLIGQEEADDESHLDPAAKEAKRRLDQRLLQSQLQWKSDITKGSNKYTYCM